MISSPELKDLSKLKVGDRVEGWCPKSRHWVRITVISVAKKSFQGTDKNFEKWCGLTKWREPEKCSNTLTSSVELEDSPWQPSKLGEYKQPSLLNAIQTLNSSLETTIQTSPSTQTLEITAPIAVSLTSTQLDFPVPEPVTLGIEPDSTTQNQNCGLKRSDVSVLDSPGLSLWKTLKDLSLEDFEQCLEDSEWQDITLTCRFLYRLRNSERPTDETEFLLSPTLTSCSSKRSRPAGQTKLEKWLRDKGILLPSQCLSAPMMASMSGFPPNWTACLSEFLPEHQAELERDTSTAEQLSQHKQQLPSVESCICPSCQQPLLKLADGCGTCGWFTTVPWNERDEWDEPLDPDDVWKLGDRVQWKKGLQQFGTVRGLRQHELLGGKLPLIVVRWDNAASDVLIPPEELWRIWEDQAEHTINSPELELSASAQASVNSPEPTRKRSPKGTRKYEGRCTVGQTNPSGRIERQIKQKRLSSGELKSYEYNLYRYQLGGVGKVYSKVVPSGKLTDVAAAIEAEHPAEVIVKWFWGVNK